MNDLFPLPAHRASLLVELIELDAANTVQLRAMLELLGAEVHLYQPGSPQEIFNLLHKPNNMAGLMILDGHGDENGLFVTELHASLRHDELAHIQDQITANDISKYASLPNQDVINLCCMGGSLEMVDAFRRAGVQTYIAADGYPEGNTATLLAAHIVDEMVRHRSTLKQAWVKAVAYEEDARCFVHATQDQIDRAS